MKPTSKPTGKESSRTQRGVSGAEQVPRTASNRTRSEADASQGSPYATSVLETCASIPRLRTFSAAIGTAGLSSLLEGNGPITIFAPTDRAFDRIPGDERTSLLNDSRRLAEILRHHVVAGRVSAPGAKKPRKVKPEFGDDLELTRSDRGFHVDQARIVKTNIRATNGVIHAIDRVLDPG